MTQAPLIIVTRDHGTVTARGQHFSIDATHRPETNVRSGLHVVIDDDCTGQGTSVRLHMYGREAFRELKALIDLIDVEMQKEETDGSS